MSLSSHLECKVLRCKIILDLKELKESGFLFGTRKIEKLLGVSSRSRRNCPFIKAVTRPVSISTIHRSDIVYLDWLNFSWRIFRIAGRVWLESPLHFLTKHSGSEESWTHEDCQNFSFFSEEFCATLSCIFSISLVWAWINEASAIIESVEEEEIEA